MCVCVCVCVGDGTALFIYGCIDEAVAVLCPHVYPRSCQSVRFLHACLSVSLIASPSVREFMLVCQYGSRSVLSFRSVCHCVCQSVRSFISVYQCGYQSVHPYSRLACLGLHNTTNVI